MCLSKLFCGNDCTWAWILFIIGIVLLLDNNCGCDNGCGYNNGCGYDRSNGCGCGNDRNTCGCC